MSEGSPERLRRVPATPIADPAMRRLRKVWHVARRHWGLDAPAATRLVVEKAHWHCDVASPVILMVDDLTNAWHGTEANGQWAPGGDWGGGLDGDRSIYQFLNQHLLADYPAVKVTFFVVAGPISAYTHEQPFRYSAPLDATPESRAFFRRLAEDSRFELAYHGMNHGQPGTRTVDFVQEWRGFLSVDAAVEQTRRGLATFERATGAAPRGGKYGGWDYNEFAEEALEQCGFLWWCRDWTPRDISGRVPHGYYTPHFFGSNLIVALPSTVHGEFWSRRQVDLLLQHRQIISIAEHIAPVRPDGLIQTPNLVDDMPALRRLFSYLRTKDVWYATGSEVASYVSAREHTTICDVTRDTFCLRYHGRFDAPELTLRIDPTCLSGTTNARLSVVNPDGTTRHAQRRRGISPCIVTVPVMPGQYRVIVDGRA